MSIITDALKKAQKKADSRKDVEVPAFTDERISRKRNTFTIPVPLVAVIFIISLGALGVVFSRIIFSDNAIAPRPAKAVNNISATVKDEEKIPASEGPVTKIISSPVPPVKGGTADSLPQGTVSAGEINLNGIMYSGNKPLAVINNIICREGEEIDDVKILNIRTESVVVEKNGVRKILHLRR